MRISLKVSNLPGSYDSTLCLPTDCTKDELFLTTLQTTLNMYGPLFCDSKLKPLISQLNLNKSDFTCSFKVKSPRSETKSNIDLYPLLVSLAVYLSIVLISTLYDLVDRYKRDMLRLKLSKVQRQMQYEEQQRKLMKNLMTEAYYEDIMQARGSID